MPHFAFPWAFALVALVPLLLWRWHRAPRGALRFSSLALLDALPPGRTSWARRGGVALRGLGLTCLILAIAGPRWPDPESRIPTEGISIALVVDASDSMKQSDLLWGTKVMTRFEAARQAVHLFVAGGEIDGTQVPGRPRDLIALVTFAARPETDCPLTLDRAALLSVLDEEYPRRLQPTNPGDALAWALHLLSKAPTRRKVIIYLTDGEDNVVLNTLRPRQAANVAAAMEIPIYAVEIEPVPDENAPKEGKDAQERLQQVAAIAKGEYFKVNDVKGLFDAYAAIDKLERDRIETHEFLRYEEAHDWFAAAALACYCLVILLEATRWRTAP